MKMSTKQDRVKSKDDVLSIPAREVKAEAEAGKHN